MPQIVRAYIITMHHTQTGMADEALRKFCESWDMKLTVHDPDVREVPACPECGAPMDYDSTADWYVCPRHTE